ncbi:hypothetical protein ACFLWX_00915 [Chloroflexota bacterium]
MSAGKIILLIFGVIVILVGAGLGLAGGTLIWLDRTHVDDQGFITSTPIDMERDSYATVTGPIEIDEVAVDVLNRMGMATTFSVEGSSLDSSKNIFIGVAGEIDLDAYLRNVEYDELVFAHRGWLSFLDVTYTNHPGSSIPPAPTTQSFWSESAHGFGTQVLEWDTSVGSHSMVLMNEDGSAGLDLTAEFKVKVPGAILGVGIGLLIGGIIVLLVGGLMIFLAIRRS